MKNINENSKTITAKSSYYLSLNASFEGEEFKRLNEILSSSEQLAFFQTYLQNIRAHENLLFIEALSELRHEKNLSQIETIVNRIWNAFLIAGAPFELKVKNKESVGDCIQAHKWGIMTNKEALYIFKDVEMEVKMFLNEKIVEFDKIYNSEKLTTFPSSNYNNKYQKKVVVIGGGFTGFTVASTLDPMPRFHVTLIDAKDSFEYTPGMVKLLVRPEETSSLRVRHNAYIKNGRVVIGYAEKIVNDAKAVKVNNEYIPFDYLVIATGSSYTSKLKSFDTSSLYRLSELSLEHNELKKAKTVLIIGGGLVGCELASEIGSHTYLPPYDEKKQITLIESCDSLVRRTHAKQQARAFNYLSGLGVQIILNEKIVDFDSGGTNSFLGSSGTCYSGYDKVFFATGTTPCSDLLQGDGDVGFESCIDHWGRIRVKPTLQLDHWKYKHIFVGGDVTNIVEEKTAYSATLAGVCIARNICRIEKGKSPIIQGSKGTLPAPSKPIHGIHSQGGIGKAQLNPLKKFFAFLSPTWAALKGFDEIEFINIVQGESSFMSKGIGRKPKVLGLPNTLYKRNSSIDAIYPENHSNSNVSYKKRVASLSPSESIKRASLINGHDLLLQVYSTNLSGSDVLYNEVTENDEENKRYHILRNPSLSDHKGNAKAYRSSSVELSY
ncbi:uncharacterized protein BX663DRAFT_510308 [Cokeromyces recurvatus]|uniref:uncharacterized protein n=1 Tax=Cokeromyces recurvatus TaxID=90255 RepID=UPI00221F65CD|nr:uncharacterized protein BX663DRAFT_510308 [Cokeromyces recurvatus]KAI7902737.1 hypothetical protein BX663DRAFT_510308 [Cokeromyces recurvatus]